MDAVQDDPLIDSRLRAGIERQVEALIQRFVRIEPPVYDEDDDDNFR